MSSQPGPMMEFLGRVAYELHLMKPMLPTYLHLLISAMFPIYTAAHASLTRPPSAARKKGTKPGREGDDDDESVEEESHKIESLTPSDAILFPVLAGGTLASLYFILKWLQDPAWLNWVLGLYFSQIGLFFAMKFLNDLFSVVRSLCLPTQYSSGGSLWKVDLDQNHYRSEKGIATSPFPSLARFLPLPSAVSRLVWTIRRLLYKNARLDLHIHGLIDLKAPIGLLDLASLAVSCLAVYYHTFIAKPWFLTNFLGFSFCYGSLQLMTPTTAWTGTLVLGALFFYDIYFVFFTPMMVTVATKLDVPIKLLFPRPDGCVFPVGAPEGSELMEEYVKCLAKKKAMAMLGLGDIVVPGMILAFALRFDLYLHYLRKASQNNSSATNDAVAKGVKPEYLNARGQWGERVWTSPKWRSEQVKATQFSKTYFYATIIGYFAGMITTVVVMHIAAHAQPALLYLVPGVLISLWGTALVKGDIKLLWQYNELPEEENKDGNGRKGGQDESATTDIGRDAQSAEETATGDHLKLEESKQLVPKRSKVKKEQRECQRLVYFAITIPKPPNSKKIKETDGVVSNGSTSPLQDSASGEVWQSTSENTATPVTGMVTRSQDRAASGEPPGKRVRRA